MISSWFDVAAVRALARAFPHGSVVLVGPRDVSLTGMPSNVHVVAPVPQSEVPSVLRSFDVGLIPFRPGPAIDAVNPIKLFEYLAAGLPVLASDFAEMRYHEDVATLYRDPDEAVALARNLVAARSNADVVRHRVRYALAHTWEGRVAQLNLLLSPRADEGAIAA
jgi:glycosyltransferase involved in cell wall biosynthesis